MGIQWVQQNSGDELPQNALVGGKENADGNNAVLYLGRATREDGSKHPGKYGETTGRGLLYSYGSKEEYTGRYEIATGDANSVRWVDHQGPIDGLSATPIEVGSENGKPIYAAQCDYGGGIIIGKISPGMSQAYCGFQGKEWPFEQYRVLCEA